MCFEPQVCCLRLEPDDLSPESPEFGNSAMLLFLGSQFIIGKTERKRKWYHSFSPAQVWFTYFFFIPNSVLLDTFLEKWCFVLKNECVIWTERNVLKEWLISCFHDDVPSCVSWSDLCLILEYRKIGSVLWNGKCAKKSAIYACQVVLKDMTWLRSLQYCKVSSCKGASLDKVF